jgi:hypothetical protein
MAIASGFPGHIPGKNPAGTFPEVSFPAGSGSAVRDDTGYDRIYPGNMPNSHGSSSLNGNPLFSIRIQKEVYKNLRQIW